MITNVITAIESENGIAREAAAVLIAHIRMMKGEAEDQHIARMTELDRLISAVSQFTTERIKAAEAIIGAQPAEFKQAAE